MECRWLPVNADRIHSLVRQTLRHGRLYHLGCASIEDGKAVDRAACQRFFESLRITNLGEQVTTTRADTHHRLIAILHLVHGFVAAATAIGVFLTVAVLIGFRTALERWLIPMDDPTDSNPGAWLSLFAVAITAVYMVGALLFTVPALAGGYGMLKHRRWARKLILVSAVVAALNVPFGTALAVYTFWYLFVDEGREL